jgi:uncharacterized membrane protein
MDATATRDGPSRASGLLLGLGFGGFIDGILMHQLLQWHHLVSNKESPRSLEGLELNILADGFFHAASLFLVAGGVVVVLAHRKQGRLARSWAYHGGLMVAGFGLFNVADGIVNHWLTGAHHVRDDLGGPASWDVGFFVLSVVVTVSGWLIHRRGVET